MPAAIEELALENKATAAVQLRDYDSCEMTVDASPWLLFHGILGHCGDYQITGTDGEIRQCLDWLLCEASWKARYKASPFLVAEEARGVAFTHGPTPHIKREFEDHFGQFMFIISEGGLDIDRLALRVPPNGDRRTLRSVLSYLEDSVHAMHDLSWALPVLAKYEGGKSWKNRFGATYSVARVLREHLDSEDVGASYLAPCFGMHWRTGLALGLRYGRRYVSEDVLQRATNRLTTAIQEGKNSQDEAGQFRIAKLAGFPERAVSSLTRSDEISHQAHTLEFVLTAVPDAELVNAAWIHRGIRWLLDALRDNASSLDYGAYSHCCHALRLYTSRIETLLGAT